MRPSRYRPTLETEQPPICTRRVTRAPREERDTQEQIDEEPLYETRTHTSVVRQGTYQPGRIDAQATRRVKVYVHDQPRPQRQHQPPLPVGTSMPFHVPRWPAYVGLAGVLMVGGWLGIGIGQQAWQMWQDDLHYGRPRTYQIDAVVGHNHDTSVTPSHFIVLNLHRQITVIEMPAGDPSKTHVYKTGIALLGSGQDLTPAQVTFKDLDGDGKPDMIVTVGEQSIAYKNENDVFSNTPMKEVK
ncbi:hypothetical protein KSC_064870 [Ktedonobacter sp. SOSP1-52]|uniref:VCBS repeat-containing protein n=1 Tax=Ktedonobacter sp. SOSP1-52 TaxID=2778366 RepID=UPI001916532A|nr:VCBS repeat-containing protein [Ktedonobacter sp. SOSP1-52]GHO67595.1 hypothetical protein KSC_064870 [Ktedonobacter sp. SOSP1-52]